MCVLTTGNSIKKLLRIIFHYLSSTKFLTPWMVKSTSPSSIGLVVITKSKLPLEDQEKTTFTCPWGTYAYRVFPFGLCNAPTTFQRAFLGIFSDLIHDCVEIYMDDFTVYGNTFKEALNNLKKSFNMMSRNQSLP
jgi:hypothetical protein